MTHLELVDLVIFTDPSMEDDDRIRIQGHLDSCSFCRSRFISINTFRSAFKNLPENVAPFELTEKCVPTELMGDFMGGRLPLSEYNDFSGHLAECDSCFERVAFFTHSSVQMAEGILQTQGTPIRFIKSVAPGGTEPQAELRQSIRHIVGRWFASPVPAYAFAASLLLFMIIWNPGGPEGIIDLNSNQVFTLYETPMQPGPSFGFSDAGRKIGETKAKLNVEKTTGGQLRFGWNPVEGAEEYHFTLQELKPNGFLEIYDIKTVAPQVLVDMSVIETGKAYRWNVAGAIGSERIFSAAGQFTFTN